MSGKFINMNNLGGNLRLINTNNTGKIAISTSNSQPGSTPTPTPTTTPTPTPTPTGFYGTGPWRITMNIAESNTLALAFAAISFDNNPGYASGWDPVKRNTVYGDLVEICDMSVTTFTSPQSNLNLVGTTSYAITGDDQGLTVIADALVGASSAPNFNRLDSSAVTNTNVISGTSFGVIDNGVVVACISSEAGRNNSARTVTSVTGGGLTWYLRKRYADPNSNCGQVMEIWYATSTIEVLGTMNVTFNGTVDCGSVIVTAWEGVNLSQPWTTSGTSTSNRNFA